MAKVTVIETPEEVLLCLHLPLSATSPERESFVSLLRALLTLQPNVSLLGQPTVSRGGLRRTRASLPAEPSASLQDLIRSLAPSQRKSTVGRLIANVSRNLADILGVEEDSLSDFLANVSGQDVGAVHAQLAGPLLGLPGVGKGLETVVLNDARRAAQRGDPEAVGAILARVEDPLQFSVGLIPGQAAVLPSQSRARQSLSRQLKALREAADRVRTRMIGGR